jgi:hypothetical protein
MIIKGNIAMRNSDRKFRREDLELDGFTRRVADLYEGRVYWAMNEGEDEAIFQVTENLA